MLNLQGLYAALLSGQNDPTQVLKQAAANNPQIAQLLEMRRGGTTFQQIAFQMAKQRGINLNQMVQNVSRFMPKR